MTPQDHTSAALPSYWFSWYLRASKNAIELPELRFAHAEEHHVCWFQAPPQRAAAAFRYSSGYAAMSTTVSIKCVADRQSVCVIARLLVQGRWVVAQL